jgi:hypothetical protein
MTPRTEILKPVIQSSEVTRYEAGEFCPILKVDYVITDADTKASYKMTCKIHPDDIKLLGTTTAKLVPVALNADCEMVEAIVHFENIIECQLPSFAA